MDDIYDAQFVKGVFDRCSGRYIAFSLFMSFGFTERWAPAMRRLAASPAPTPAISATPPRLPRCCGRRD